MRGSNKVQLKNRLFQNVYLQSFFCLQPPLEVKYSSCVSSRILLAETTQSFNCVIKLI